MVDRIQPRHDILVRIKRAVLAGRVIFSEKASLELEADDLTELDVAEAIVGAAAVYKTLRSRSPLRLENDLLYVIIGTTYQGVIVYTKGKLVRRGGLDYYYFLVSAKRAV